MGAFELVKEVDNGEKPLNELLTRSMVDLYVGSENTHWILHEKLLCTRSGFFKAVFQAPKHRKSNSGSSSPRIDDTPNARASKSFGLPEEDDEPFRAFVGWLYSGQIVPPQQEAHLTTLFELYLMGEKWAVPALEKQVLGAVRTWYRTSDTYPGLRRVQYIYANTSKESPMRSLLVNSVARMLALGDGIPQHWDKALRKNGQLAVDLMMCVQSWKLEPERVPDLREEQVEEADIDEGKVEEEVKKTADQMKNLGINGGQERAEQLTNGWKEYEPDTKPKMNGIKPEINGIKPETDVLTAS